MTLGSGHFKFNSHGVNELLHGSRGDVAKELLRRGLRVQKLAKEKCPVDSGRLRSSIRVVMLRDTSPVCRVGTEVEYAAAVHNGRRAMTIRPVSASVLHFEVDGVEVFVSEVHQKARPGRPFLRDALVAAGYTSKV